MIAQNGTLVDTHGYLRGMLSQVSLPFAFDYDKPLRYSSDVGEAWNLYVHKLRDGIVVLGARRETTPEGVDQMFASNAIRFGTTVEEARHTPDRAVSEPIEFAVIDQNGVLVWAIGGIPLRASSPAIPSEPTMAPVRRIEDKTYASFLDPVVSKSGTAVGLIAVFEDITSDQRILRRSAVFNGIVAALLWIITVVLSAAWPVRPAVIACGQSHLTPYRPARCAPAALLAAVGY